MQIKVVVSTTTIDDETFSVSISVIDQGIGINEADLPNIFKPHFKTTDEESRALNPSSHSIGLSFGSRISEGLGGSLKVVSELGDGAEFTFTFPAKIVPPVVINPQSRNFDFNPERGLSRIKRHSQKNA